MPPITSPRDGTRAKRARRGASQRADTRASTAAGTGSSSAVPSRGAWSVRAIKSRCRSIRQSIEVHELATSEEVAAYWPGGAENPEHGLGGWIYCYANMVRFNGRLERITHIESNAVHAAVADGVVLDALRAEPIAVERVGAALDAPPLYIYPKSLGALLHVHALNAQLAWMTKQHTMLRYKIDREHRADLAELEPRVLATMAYTLQLLAWIVTTKPGTGVCSADGQRDDMPYDADDDRPEPPAHIRALEPWDIVRICDAHRRHFVRAAAISALIDETSQEDGGRRPSWSAFVGAMAIDLGENPVTLMRHRALVSLLAAARLNAGVKNPPKSDDDGADAGGRAA